MAQQFGLGKGLASLIPDDGKKDTEKTPLKTVQHKEVKKSVEEMSPQELPLHAIVVNPHQPRKTFNAEKLEELAESIRKHGILQPLVVHPLGNDTYELIAGERRFRASKKAGLTKVPIIIRKVDDQQKLELAILENIQRHDLSPIEEAQAYDTLSEMFHLSQEQIAEKMGKSRSAIANTMRLLGLPLEMQKALSEERISEGHAKALLSLKNPQKQLALFTRIEKNNLTVRQAEKLAKEELGEKKDIQITKKDPEIESIEEELRETLGTKVSVKRKGKGAKITIDCYSEKDLFDLVSKVK